MKARSWKGAELRFARDVGVERKPCDGSRAGADFEDGIACYQLKVRKAIPGWLWGWLAGIQGTGQGKGKAGILVLKKPRQDDVDALVVMSWRDWVELHGNPKNGKDYEWGCGCYMASGNAVACAKHSPFPFTGN
jgi:hypothetical protein